MQFACAAQPRERLPAFHALLLFHNQVVAVAVCGEQIGAVLYHHQLAVAARPVAAENHLPVGGGDNGLVCRALQFYAARAAAKRFADARTRQRVLPCQPCVVGGFARCSNSGRADGGGGRGGYAGCGDCSNNGRGLNCARAGNGCAGYAQGLSHAEVFVLQMVYRAKLAYGHAVALGDAV